MSKSKAESRSVRHSNINQVAEDESSDEDEVYTSLNMNPTSKDQPLFQIKVHDTPVTVTADSGAIINELDKRDYHWLPNGPKLETISVKIYAYQSKEPLRVLGKFNSTLKSETKEMNEKFYVVKGSGGSLLSLKTS